MALVVRTGRRLGTPPTPPVGVESNVLLMAADPQPRDNASEDDRWADTCTLIRATPHDALGIAGDLCDSYTASRIAAYDAGAKAGSPSVHDTAHVAWGNHDVGAAWPTSFNHLGSPLGGISVDQPYHSLDMPNGWHIVFAFLTRDFIDLRIGDDDAQLAWLEADLDAHAGIPTLVVWHIGRYTTQSERTPGNVLGAKDAWSLLLTKPWVEAVISGHSHFYERFARMDADGGVDAVDGIRQFNLPSCGIETPHPVVSMTGLEARSAGTQHGIGRFTLHADSYEWEFLTPAGREDELVPDTGSQAVRYPLT